MEEVNFSNFKEAISKVFNEDGVWVCAHCFWLGVDENICTVCNITSRAFIWLKEIEKTLDSLKALNIKIIDEQDIKVYMLDKLIGKYTDLSLGSLENFVSESRAFLGNDRKIEMEQVEIKEEGSDEFVLELRFETYNEKEIEKIEEIYSKYSKDMVNIGVYLSCLNR